MTQINMPDITMPDTEGVNDLKQQLAALQNGNPTPEDLMQIQIAMQKWNTAVEQQSQMLKDMSDTLKGIIQKM